jgi:hypothetical protein
MKEGCIMTMPKRRSWLSAPFARGLHAPAKPAASRQLLRFRPGVEALEERVVPAFNLTVGTIGTTTGVSTTTNDGNTTFTADAPNAFLNVADINAALSSGSGGVLVQSDPSGPSSIVIEPNSQIIGAEAINETEGLTFKAIGSIFVGSGSVLEITASPSAGSVNGQVVLDIGYYYGEDSAGVGAAIIQGTLASPETPYIDAPSSTNNVIIDYANGASLPDGLGYDCGGHGLNSLTVSDLNSGASNHTYAVDYGTPEVPQSGVDPSSVTRDGAPRFLAST